MGKKDRLLVILVTAAVAAGIVGGIAGLYFVMRVVQTVLGDTGGGLLFLFLLAFFTLYPIVRDEIKNWG